MLTLHTGFSMRSKENKVHIVSTVQVNRPLAAPDQILNRSAFLHFLPIILSTISEIDFSFAKSNQVFLTGDCLFSQNQIFPLIYLDYS